MAVIFAKNLVFDDRGHCDNFVNRIGVQLAAGFFEFCPFFLKIIESEINKVLRLEVFRIEEISVRIKVSF